MHRNHTMNAAIQMKNQKLHSRTSQKLVVMLSMQSSRCGVAMIRALTCAVVPSLPTASRCCLSR